MQQASLFGPTGVCFFDLGRGTRATGTAAAPKAMRYFADRYQVPIVTDPADLTGFRTVLFSLMCFRDFYRVAQVSRFKRAGQEWIAGGCAAATPTAVTWIMDHVWVGDCMDSFPLILRGARDLPGFLHADAPDAPVQYVVEPIRPDPLNAIEIETSRGCRRRCLFCIHPWRQPYQQQDQGAVEQFIRTRPGSVGLVSNASDDVTYYPALSALLARLGKVDLVLSNSLQGLTEQVIVERKRELGLGIEGMSERLRRYVNKPIARDLLRDRVGMCLQYGRQVRTIYQFNLPGETGADLDELLEDVRYLRAQHRTGSWSVPFIPNQPSAHTPFQWVTPRYSLDMLARLTEFRTSLFGSKATGIAMYCPAPLGPAKWLAQLIAEWIPVTPKVLAAVQHLPAKVDLPTMVQALDAAGVMLPAAFLKRDRGTVFPWSNVRMAAGLPDPWRAYDRMVRRIEADGRAA